jgi:hypothetical protein
MYKARSALQRWTPCGSHLRAKTGRKRGDKGDDDNTTTWLGVVALPTQ